MSHSTFDTIPPPTQNIPQLNQLIANTLIYSQCISQHNKSKYDTIQEYDTIELQLHTIDQLRLQLCDKLNQSTNNLNRLKQRIINYELNKQQLMVNKTECNQSYESTVHRLSVLQSEQTELDIQHNTLNNQLIQQTVYEQTLSNDKASRYELSKLSTNIDALESQVKDTLQLKCMLDKESMMQNQSNLSVPQNNSVQQRLNTVNKTLQLQQSQYKAEKEKYNKLRADLTDTAAIQRVQSCIHELKSQIAGIQTQSNKLNVECNELSDKLQLLDTQREHIAESLNSTNIHIQSTTVKHNQLFASIARSESKLQQLSQQKTDVSNKCRDILERYESYNQQDIKYYNNLLHDNELIDRYISTEQRNTQPTTPREITRAGSLLNKHDIPDTHDHTHPLQAPVPPPVPATPDWLTLHITQPLSTCAILNTNINHIKFDQSLIQLNTGNNTLTYESLVTLITNTDSTAEHTNSTQQIIQYSTQLSDIVHIELIPLITTAQPILSHQQPSLQRQLSVSSSFEIQIGCKRNCMDLITNNVLSDGLWIQMKSTDNIDSIITIRRLYESVKLYQLNNDIVLFNKPNNQFPLAMFSTVTPAPPTIKSLHITDDSDDQLIHPLAMSTDSLDSMMSPEPESTDTTTSYTPSNILRRLGTTASSYLTNTVPSLIRRMSSSKPNSTLSSPHHRLEDMSVANAVVRRYSQTDNTTDQHLIDTSTIYITGDSEVITREQLTILCNEMPLRYHLSIWKCIYSISIHGISLREFFTNTNNMNGTVCVLKTSTGDIFGGCNSDSWHPCKSRSDLYYGSRESYVYNINQQLINNTSGNDNELHLPCCSNTYIHIYKPTMNNDLYQFTSDAAIGMGAYSMAWQIDAQFKYGTSDRSQTYHNPRLTQNRDFTVVRFEVWAPSM